MPDRCPLIVILLLAIFLLFLVKSVAAVADRKDEKTVPRPSAQKCLEQNIRAASDDTALPCVESGIPPQGSSPLPQPPTAPSVGISDEKRLVRELPAYKSGYFLHPEALKFCELLAQEIYTLKETGHKVDLIIITGYADGQRNIGVPQGRERVPSRCQPIAPNPTINDKELAGLRGCAMWDLLSDILEEQKALSGFGWKTDPIQDIEDGGPSGDPYRKTVVEVIWQ